VIGLLNRFSVLVMVEQEYKHMTPIYVPTFK